MGETQKRLERVAEGLRVGRITTDVARIAAAMAPRWRDKVLKLDGVEVVYCDDTDDFEVWALVADGPDDCMWDVVGTTSSRIEAFDMAHEISDRMEETVV